MLHEGLRDEARERSLRAVGVAEHVTVQGEATSHRATKAIKVLFEHRRGLCVALYLPYRKRFFRRYEVGKSFAVDAKPEIRAWAGESL